MHRIHGGFYRGAFGGAAILFLVGAAVFGGMGLWQGLAIRQAFLDRGVWADGVSAEGGMVSGKKTTRYLILHDYELKVTYRDRAGAEHHDETSFAMFFGSPEDQDPVLRYDPAQPEHFAVSWGAEHMISRVVTSLILLAPALAIGVIFMVGAVAIVIGTRRRAGALAAGTFTRVDGKDGSAWPKGGEPLFADDKGKEILAVKIAGRGGKEEVVPLRADGYPLRLSPAELEEARLKSAPVA